MSLKHLAGLALAAGLFALPLQAETPQPNPADWPAVLAEARGQTCIKTCNNNVELIWLKRNLVLIM